MDKDTLRTLIKSIIDNTQPPYYDTTRFIIHSALESIGIIVGAFGLWFAIKAFKEAREAKKAANEAGKAVKIQSVTIELTELIQRLDKINIEINYSQARDLYSEINRKV